jgi:hypothetical protein
LSLCLASVVICAWASAPSVQTTQVLLLLRCTATQKQLAAPLLHSAPPAAFPAACLQGPALEAGSSCCQAVDAEAMSCLESAAPVATTESADQSCCHSSGAAWAVLQRGAQSSLLAAAVHSAPAIWSCKGSRGSHNCSLIERQEAALECHLGTALRQAPEGLLHSQQLSTHEEAGLQSYQLLCMSSQQPGTLHAEATRVEHAAKHS